MGVSKNSGTPKSSILIGFSIVNHPFWGTPILGNTHVGVNVIVRHTPTHPTNIPPQSLKNNLGQVESTAPWRLKSNRN